MKTNVRVAGISAGLVLGAFLIYQGRIPHSSPPPSLPPASAGTPTAIQPGAGLSQSAGPAAPQDLASPEAAPPFPTPNPDALVAFRAWTGTFLGASPSDRAAMIDEGTALANARRAVFKQLITENPRRALEEALPMVVRQQLPPAVVARLEERVNGRAALRVLHGDSFGDEPVAQTVRLAEFASGRTYEAHVHGRRAESTRWLAGVSLSGVALDHQLALQDEPLRSLEVGEVPDSAKPVVAVCPVCGALAFDETKRGQPITPPTRAVEAFGETVFVCDGTHEVAFREMLIQAEGASGGAYGFTGILPAVPTPSVGNVKVLVIPLTFADQNDVPSSESALYTMMRDVGDFYADSSFGKLTLTTTVTPPIKLPHNEAWYVNKDSSNGGPIDGLGLEHAHARAEARKMGYDDAEYDCVVVRLRGGPRATGGWGGGSSVWTYSDGVGVVAHELGHVFGLGHANFWNTGGTSAIGVGANEEYGDSYDLMGGGGVPNGHFAPQGKNQVRWLPDAYFTDITASGLYRIHACDQPVLDPSKRYALKIRKDNAKTYWGELRSVHTGSTSRPWADYGLVLGWKFSGGGGGYRQLLDTTPGSPFGKDDAPISVGRTFSDDEAGIHITALAVHPATPGEAKSIDLVVNLGAFPSNQPPTLALAASATVVPANVPVTFTAAAGDPDGDVLAYSWQHFGDTSYKSASSNSPAITRSFPSSGTYVVTCTVSDMKGGTTQRNVLVTVGSGGGRFTISGRVTLGGVGLANVIVNANSANGVVTDSDGYYTIPNLSAATYVMTPLLYGCSFGELFNNSVAVGPNFTGADFEAAEVARVSLAATVASAVESNAAAPAQFVLTRTGDVSQPLTVNLIAASGSATSGTDYTNAPVFASGSQGYVTLTIPAATNALAVHIVPINDALAEGLETVTFELAPGDGYLVAGLARATAVLDDDDSALPKVSLAVTEAKTIEGSAWPATITFTRTGATTHALAVAYSVRGTAASGSDFLPLSGTNTIPAGAASATLTVTTVNDAVSESVETVIISIANSPGFLADPLANTATVSIADDDAQIVTVVATDAMATERDLTVPGTAPDTATFLITRAGDLSAPLTVYYAVSGVISGGADNALHGVDFEPLPGVLIMPAGQASGAVTIVPLWDGIGEGAETVSLQLGAGPTNYRLGSPSSATITLADAGDPPFVDVLGVDNAVEGGAAGRFRFTLRGSAASNIVVNYTLSGTATSGSDFTALPGSVTLSGNGINTVDISVTPTNDALAEDLETITLTISPSPNYQTYPPTSAATIWMMDNEQPALFVDAHNTSYPPSIPENGGSAAFYVSRSGSTAGSLTVNYSLSGSASNGVDYQPLSGTTNIAAGALGVDIPIAALNDALAEGVETITLNLEPGAYGRGPSATLYLTDDESPAISVGFPALAATNSESVASATIPVTLSATSAAPVTVEYLVDTGGRATSTANGSTPSPLPYWVRCERLGDTVIGSVSPDGTNWTGVSTQTLAMASASYLAGLHVCSFNTSLRSTSVFDNVTITNLQAGGTVGARTGANLGSTSLSGSATVAGSTYTVAGAGDNVEGTTDQGYFAYWPISNSTNCTITARVASQQNTASGATAGAMIRENTANNARRGYMAATPGAGLEFHYRTSTGGTEAKVTLVPSLPLWVRLQRSGGTMQAFQSSDGATWIQVSTNLDLALGPEVLAGLAVSSQAEGPLATAVIDGVSFAPDPMPLLEGRTVGFSATQGAHTEAGGVFTMSGSADGINGTSDDFYFVSAPVTGDFTLTARVTSLQSSASSPQAGLCVRESTGRRVRSVYLGGRPGLAPQLAWRNTTLTLANGLGVDWNLTPGVLTFAPGVATQSITLQIVSDARPEPDEPVTIILRNANNARLGNATFTYLIVDDDSASALPFAGFAAAMGSASEAGGTVLVPVTLSAPATAVGTIDYAITAGTATADGDFTVATGMLTFTAGDTVQNIPLTLLDDAALETNETVLLTLSNPAGLLTNTLIQHTLTILDDDTPVVTASSTDTNAAEAGDPALVTLTRTGSTNSDLTVNLTRTGTATAGTDYTGINSTAIIPAGATNLSLTLTPVQDTTSEGTETAIITVTAGTGYTVGLPSSVTTFIADDDRNVVTISATGATAVEGGSNGTFTVTRTGSTNASLTVSLTVSGTATSGSDYTTTPSSITSFVLSAGQASRAITVTPVNDSAIEGNETMLVQIAAGTYGIGAPGYDSVTIVDNDVAPAVFISSPGAQGVAIAPSNGVEFVADASDDGLPQPLSYAWTQVAGPGVMTFLAPTHTRTPATFPAPGTYLVRVTVSDGQFTASDQLNVTAGSTTNLVPADWISSDIGPTTLPGFSGISGSNWVMSAVGVGFTSNSDRAHAVTRQVTGDGRVVARVVSITNAAGLTNAEAGLSIRDSMHRYARRAALVYQSAAKTLRFRPRVTNNTTDYSVSVTNLNLPLWLKLERSASSNTVAAFYATNNAGAPGPWTQIGTNVVITMDATADYSLTADSGSDTAAARVSFDNLTLTPAPAGPAAIVEDFGDGMQAGTYAYDSVNDIHTLNGDGSLDGSGLFRGQQFAGDFVLTVLQTNATSSANSSLSGIMIRDTMDNGAMVFFGRNPNGSFGCYVWRTNPKGGTSSLAGVTHRRRWFRLVRRGNTVTALHAPDNAGVPGAWIQLGQPQTVFLQPVVMAGLYCDNAGGVGYNTAHFTKLSVVPRHIAPIVDAGPAPTNTTSPVTLAGAVADDNLPSPFAAWWTAAAAPGPVAFANSNAPATTATLATSGAYLLRLWADDGIAHTFDDVSFDFTSSPFRAWQSAHFPGGASNPSAAPDADPDHDKQNNAAEYATGTNPNVANPNPIGAEIVSIGPDRFLSVVIPRNPAATDSAVSVEASSDLVPGAWSTEGLITEVNTATLLRVRDGVALESAPHRFLRVRIALALP